MNRMTDYDRRAEKVLFFLRRFANQVAPSTPGRVRSYVTAFAALMLATATGRPQSVFPATSLSSSAAQQVVTVTASAAGKVDRAAILTLGQTGLDFTLPQSPASSCTGVTLTVGGAMPSCGQSVQFTPEAPGLRIGAVELFDASGDLLGEALISGTGVGGLAVLLPGNVIPVAGDGNYLDPVVDNIPALTAELSSPTSVARDGAGNLYIADSNHNRIRVVSAATGQITTIAGTGTASYTGDKGPATSATLNAPAGIALDGAGNLYIADTGNNAIRRVDAVTQTITTVAGNGSGLPGFEGDGSGATSPAVLLNGPEGIAVDVSGDLYIADTNNQVIREVSVTTGEINTVAGEYFGPFGAGFGGYNGDGKLATMATLNLPYAVAFDEAGDMFIADSANNRIRMVKASTHMIATAAGDGMAGSTGDNGAATQAELNAPTGIALDAAGNLYIADTQNNRIRKVNAASTYINTLTASGGEYLTGANDLKNTVSIRGPQGLFVDSNGNLTIANTLTMQVWEIQSNLAALDFTGTRVRQGSLSAPLFQTVENDGNDVTSPLAFTAIDSSANAQVDNSIGQGACATAQPLAVDGECTIGVMFSPAAAPVLTTNTTEAGTVSAAYATVAGTSGPNSPLAIVAVGVAEPLNSTTTAVTAAPDPSLFGQSLVFTVQVTTGAGTGALTGTVSITDNFGGNAATLVSGLAVNASGAATFSIATLPVGTHLITATYSGDSSHSPSSSTDNGVAPWTQIVEEQTSIALTTSVNPSLVGQSVTFTATVTAPDGGGLMPDGTVSFLDGATMLFTGQLNAGVITFTTSTLTNGLHPITAVYSGDVSKEILGETSVVINQDVQQTATIVVTTSASPSNYGNPVTFTATIASSATVAAGGTANFYDANIKIGSGTLSGGSPDIAQFTTAALAVGTHSITAAYGGDNYNTAASSAALTQVVAQTVTSDAIAATPIPGIAGTAETITDAVTVTSGAGTPTGLVTFTSGTTVLGTASLSTAGIASISPILGPGSYSIVAAYAGDAEDGSSKSAPLALTVAQAQTTTVVAAVPNPSSWLGAVTFTATVTGNGAMPTGTVEFFANAALIGAGTLNQNGVATLTYANLAIGTYPITATYMGDTNDAGSTSAAVSLTVGKIPTSTGIGSSTTTGASSQVNLVATVVANVGPVPTGTVTFSNAQTTLGTETLDASGVASLTLNLPAGTYAVEAVYSGDATHLGSTSMPITVTTNPVDFTLSASPATVTMKSSQYAELGVIMSSVGGFTDTIGLGCVALPPGVSCHFSSPSVPLPANGNATAQLTIDTNSPLTGGSLAMSGRAKSANARQAVIFLPFALLVGCIFWRLRRRSISLLTMFLLAVVSVAAIFTMGCNGISTTSAPPGNYTIQVVASGANTGVVEYQSVSITITQ